jgi:hypothetical protein
VNQIRIPRRSKTRRIRKTNRFRSLPVNTLYCDTLPQKKYPRAPHWVRQKPKLAPHRLGRYLYRGNSKTRNIIRSPCILPGKKKTLFFQSQLLHQFSQSVNCHCLRIRGIISRWGRFLWPVLGRSWSLGVGCGCRRRGGAERQTRRDPGSGGSRNSARVVPLKRLYILR